MAGIEKLIEMLRSPKASTRFEACELLRVAPVITPEGIAALENALHDPDPGVVESAKSVLAVHRGRKLPTPSGLSARDTEALRAKNVYMWLWFSPILTIPTVAFLLFKDPGHELTCGGVSWEYCDYNRAFLVTCLIAILGSALWHLVLLVPALDRQSQFVRWHGRQALLLASIRSSIPLAFAAYDGLAGGNGGLLLLSIPVLIIVWLSGTLWAQGQARRGDCALMRWTGHGAELPLPTAKAHTASAHGQGPLIPERAGHQAAYDQGLRLSEQGKPDEAARVLHRLLVSDAPVDLKTRAADELRQVGDTDEDLTADVLVAIFRFGRDLVHRRMALAELERLGLVEAL